METADALKSLWHGIGQSKKPCCQPQSELLETEVELTQQGNPSRAATVKCQTDALPKGNFLTHLLVQSDLSVMKLELYFIIICYIKIVYFIYFIINFINI